MHHSDSQPRSLSVGNRRRRTRKLSTPQRRQQHIDSREGQQGSSRVACQNTCSQPHTLQEIAHVGSISAASCGSTGESGDTADPRYVESEKVLGDSENRVDGIKKESTHEFIVDQWYDLGPIPYKYAYSPASPEPSSTEKVEITDTTADGCTEISEACEHSKPKLENRMSNRVPSSDMFDSISGMQIPNPTQVCPSADIQGTAGSTEAAKGKEPNKGNHRAGPNGATPMSIFRPFLGCPLTNTGNSFILQPNHFPIPVHAAAPYFHMAPPPTTESTSGSTSVVAGQSHSYLPSVRLVHPDTACPDVRSEAGAVALSQGTHSYSPYAEADQVLATPSGMPCSMTLPLLPPNPAPVHSPAVAGHFLAPRYTGCQSDLEYPEFLYPHRVYQSNSCHSPGVLLVPSHPYYVQQMPFVPLIPAVNCNHLHVPRCSASFNTGRHDSGPQPVAADRNLTTPTGSSATSLPRTTNSVTTSTPIMDSDQPGSTEKQTADTGPVSQHRARVKVKAKIASSTDFIDPTTIKFGLDDVDTEDDLSKLNDCSDCSDKEWYPSNRDLKTSYRRDHHSGNGWTPKKGGQVELDNSVNKTCSRRRQRPSRELAECNQCGKVFKGSYYLRRHQMSHNDIRPFQCSTCHKCFKQKAHLIGHQSVHERALKLHVADGKPLSPKPKSSLLGSKCPGRPKKAYSEKDRACKECGKIFKTVYRLKRHELSHTDVRPFSCRICGKAFKQTGHRNEHEANHENTKKRFLCNLCGVVFRCRSSFNNHMRSHGMEKLRLETTRSDVDGTCVENKQENNEVCHSGYDCPYCIEKFATAQALNSHLETHVEVQQRRHVQPYSCDVCRRAFTYRHNLIKHRLIHKAPDKFAQFYKEKFEAHVASGKPSFKCTKCSKVFIRKETLAKHCKIHTGSKPFKCAICSHEFTQNVHLKVHMRKHTGSRPFQCKECSKSFIDSTALAKHIEYEACNTDNCLYRCKLCEKMHYYLGSLKKHIRKRHSANEEDVDKYIIKSERSVKRRGASEGEKYPCQVCSSSFSEKCNLVRHIKRKHAILVELLQKELEGMHTKVAVDQDNTLDPVRKDKELDSNRQLTVVTERPWLMCYVPATGVSVSREAATSSRDVSSSGELVIEKLPSSESVNTRDEVASSEQHAEGHNIAAKTLEIPPPNLRSNATTEPVNSSARPIATCGGADHALDRNSLSAEGDRTSSLLKRTEGEEGTTAYLEGFHSSDFVLGEKQLGQQCAHKSFLCKNPCCSDVQGNNSQTPEKPSVQREEFATSAGQCNIEEESSSPTDIHFLYKIGLVVSSKGKVPGEPVVKQSWNAGDECSCNSCMPVCISLTRLGNSSVSSDEPQSYSQLYRQESQTPTLASNISGSFSFTPGNAGNNRDDELATTDDSCSLGCSRESKQCSNLSPPGGSCDVTASCEMYGTKHNFDVSESHLCVAEHPGSEVGHRPCVMGHPKDTEQHPVEAEHNRTESEHHPSEITHSSQAEHLHSEVVYHSEVEHRGSEVICLRTTEHRVSRVEHHHSESLPHPIEAEHNSIEAEPYLSAGEHSSQLEHHHSEVEHSIKLEHHSSEVEHAINLKHHQNEVEHSIKLEHHHSQVKYLSQVEGHFSEAMRHPGEARHHSGEAERHPSEARHNSGEAERHPSEARHNSGESERHPSEARHHSGEAERHPSEARHNSGESERHPSEARHHSGEAERHPSELEFVPLRCKHHCQHSFTRCAEESDNTFNEHRTAECDTQNRICIKNDKIARMSDTSVLHRLGTGESACLPADSSSGVTLGSDGAHCQLKSALGQACIATDTVCTLSIHTTTTTPAAQCMPREQGNRGGQKPQGVTQRASPAGRVGTSSSVSVLLQCDSERSNVCMTSPHLGSTPKTSQLLGPKAVLCVVTSVEAVTSDSGKVPPGAISTWPPSVSLSDRYAEESRNDTKLHDLINTEDAILSQKRKPFDSSSLTNMAAKDKTQGSSEHVPYEVVSNPARPHVHSTNFSRNVGSHAWTVERSNNGYEACPTESHLNYLGLLACKDAHEVKNKSTPIKELYQKYRPWLEEVVCSTRPRRSRFAYKWGTATRGMKILGSATTVAEQLTYIRRTSFQSKEKKTKLRKASVYGNASSSMEAGDKQLSILVEPSLMTACVDSGLEERHTEIEKTKEQSLQTSAEIGSRDSDVLLTSGHTSRSISPVAQRLATTTPPSATSSTADSHKAARPSTLPAAASAATSEAVSGCAESSSPPSTPDSTVKGKQVYVCLVCNKYFTAGHQLKRHALTHTDHRPYSCDKCGRAFRQKVHLSDHTKRHQGQRPFVCGGCGKRFVLKNEMNQHIKNHCRGSLGIFKNVTFLSDKRAFRVAMKEARPLPGASQAVPAADGHGQDCMLMLGQCYRAGDVISNGTITLKVIESAYNQAQGKPDCSVPPTTTTRPPLGAPAASAPSPTSDCRRSSNDGDSTDQPCQLSQEHPEHEIRDDRAGL